MNRRKFLEVMAVTTAAPLAGSAWSAGRERPERPKETVSGEMRYRLLGSTGEQVSVIGLGGHFAAFEQPGLFVNELRACFRKVR